MGAWRSASEGSLMKMPDMSDRPGQKGSERMKGRMLLAQGEHKRECPVRATMAVCVNQLQMFCHCRWHVTRGQCWSILLSVKSFTPPQRGGRPKFCIYWWQL